MMGGNLRKENLVQNEGLFGGLINNILSLCRDCNTLRKLWIFFRASYCCVAYALAFWAF